MKYFSLHIGAHKTATTIFQQYLESHSEQLEKEKHCFLGPSRLRSTLIKLINKKSHSEQLEHEKHCFLGPSRLRRTLSNLINKKSNFRSLYHTPSSDDVALLWKRQIHLIRSSCHNLALSEENILGGCRMLLKQGQLYITAEPRLKAAHDLLPRPPDAILLCVRNMADFLPSAYCETLRHRTSYLTFQRYIHGVDRLSLSWLPLVQSVLRAFPTSTLYVWRFEDFPGNSPAILKAMFGSDAFVSLAQHFSSNKVRASPSGKAMRIMEAASAHLAAGEFPKLRNALERLFPIDEHNEKFAPLANEKAAIMRRYEQDVDRISAEPRVVILRRD